MRRLACLLLLVALTAPLRPAAAQENPHPFRFLAEREDKGPADPAALVQGNARAQAIAAEALYVQRAYRTLRAKARLITREDVQRLVLTMLANPAPTFLEALDSKEAALERLRKARLASASLDVATLFPPVETPSRAPQPLWAAPGSVGHHTYPGGLAVHTLFNLTRAEALMESYRGAFGLEADPDLARAAVLLHDVMKTWCCQWLPDGTVLDEATVAKTRGHHVLLLAELAHRQIPNDVLFSTAAVHSAPWDGFSSRRKTRDFVRAACLIVNRDATPVLADFDRWDPDPAAFVVNLADSDFPLASHGQMEVSRILVSAHGAGQIAFPSLAGTTAVRMIRSWAFARLGALGCYQILRKEGKDALLERVRQTLPAECPF